ncbi:shikimate kinase [Telmatobacter bradus]|uniref:shikimate kinase n=1 Tax=Telmatobacter bradus TaxID=474953 RepID=UPI003B432B3E
MTSATFSSNPPQTIRRIVLTGFMGSGKSTVGPQLAHTLGWRFVDADDAIVQQAGVAIPEIFRTQGEAAFRDLEHKAIARLAAEDRLVLALGGGAIETEATRRLLLSDPATRLIHLEVTLETTLLRCHGTEGDRPVFADHANLKARYERRLPLYRLAHINLNANQATPVQLVETIAAGL